MTHEAPLDFVDYFVPNEELVATSTNSTLHLETTTTEGIHVDWKHTVIYNSLGTICGVLMLVAILLFLMCKIFGERCHGVVDRIVGRAECPDDTQPSPCGDGDGIADIHETV